MDPSFLLFVLIVSFALFFGAQLVEPHSGRPLKSSADTLTESFEDSGRRPRRSFLRKRKTGASAKLAVQKALGLMARREEFQDKIRKLNEGIAALRSSPF